jgi:hypothetical protein
MSLFFVLRRNTSRYTALTATLLMASDIFFIRSVGWDYVDVGVLCYLSLTFLGLTIAAESSRPLFWVAMAGFCFTSAVFIHLGSVVTAVSVIGYAWYVLDLRRVGLRRLLVLLLAASTGAAICQILYGVLNVLIWKSGFFFITRQITVARFELNTLPQWRPLSELLEYGMWLVMHLAAYVAGIFLLVLARTRTLLRLTRFQTYCFASVAVQYSLCIILDYFHLSYFLSRGGLYITFFIVSTYLSIGAILPQAMPAVLTWLAGWLFAASLIIRLCLEGGTALPGAGVLPVWSLGLLIAANLGIIGWARHKTVTGVGLTAIALLSLLINWRFIRDDTIYTAHDIIAREAGRIMPRFLIDKNDPLYLPVMAGLISSFTERAWWLRGETFPIPPSASLREKLFVVSSTLSDYDVVRNALVPEVDTVKPLSFAHIERKGGDFWIFGFEVTNRVSLPATLGKFQSRRNAIPGSALPSLVGRTEGEARLAIAGETPKGVLTYGPYAGLAPGHYDIVISYRATGGGSSWDVTVNDGNDPAHVLQSGELADTGGEERELRVPLTFPGFAVMEARTFYAGSGTLAVEAIGIRPLDAPPP